MRMKELLVAGPTSNPSLQGQVDSADVCQPLFVRQAGLAMSIDWTEIHFNICIWSSFSWNWSSSVCRCWLTSRRSFIRIAGRESAPYLPLLQIHPRHRQRRQVTLMMIVISNLLQVQVKVLVSPPTLSSTLHPVQVRIFIETRSDHHHHHHHDQECHQPRPDLVILSPFSRLSHQDFRPISLQVSRWKKKHYFRPEVSE